MEVCVMTTDQPAAHEQYQLRQGDPVIVKDDGWAWSETERKVFLIVRLPDDALTTEGWANLISPQRVLRTFLIDGVEETDDYQLRARRYALDLDKVTPERKAEIVSTSDEKPISDGEFTIRDFVDKEGSASRFRNGDQLLSGRI